MNKVRLESSKKGQTRSISLITDKVVSEVKR